MIQAIHWLADIIGYGAIVLGGAYFALLIWAPILERIVKMLGINRDILIAARRVYAERRAARALQSESP